MDANTNPIRAARKRQRLTLQQLADLVGTSKSTISLWENGLRNPRRKRANLLVQLLPGLGLEDIYRSVA
jgi:transcriptional regulator with XRE-family HTH domain